MGEPRPGEPSPPPYICGKYINSPDCEYPSCDFIVDTEKGTHQCKYLDTTLPEFPPDPPSGEPPVEG